MTQEQRDFVEQSSKSKVCPEFDFIRVKAICLGINSAGQLWEFHEAIISGWKEYKGS